MTPPILPIVPAVQTYCDWLNHWTTAQGDDRTYTLEEFGIHSDNAPGSDLNPHGWIRVGTIITLDEETKLAIIELTDGDEGGPHQLTLWFKAITKPYSETAAFPITVGWELTDMLQEFDTLRQLIFTDGSFNPHTLPA